MEEPRAPRLQAYIDRIWGALLMRRSDWEQLIQHGTAPVEIEISLTPFAAVADSSKIVASFAERLENGEGLITIFREDPADVPESINVDKFRIWENFHLQPEYPRVVAEASTRDDSEMHSFLADYVVIKPLKKDKDHHRSDLPARYKAILEQKKKAR